MLREIEAAVSSLGFRDLPIGVRGPGEFEEALSTMTKGHVDALLVGDDPTFATHRRRLPALAAKHRLPTLFGSRDFVLCRPGA